MKMFLFIGALALGAGALYQNDVERAARQRAAADSALKLAEDAARVARETHRRAVAHICPPGQMEKYVIEPRIGAVSERIVCRPAPDGTRCAQGRPGLGFHCAPVE